jgi:hypothetical protein
MHSSHPPSGLIGAGHHHMSVEHEAIRNQSLKGSYPVPSRAHEKRLGYALLSALIPGAGQFAAGYRWRGAIMIVVSLLIVAVALYYYQQGTSTILSYMVQPRILIALLVINAAILLFRLGAIVDAFLCSRPADAPKLEGWKRAIVVTVLVLMLGATAAPHALFGYYTYLSYQTITDVFAIDQPSTAASQPVFTSTISGTTNTEWLNDDRQCCPAISPPAWLASSRAGRSKTRFITGNRDGKEHPTGQPDTLITR